MIVAMLLETSRMRIETVNAADAVQLMKYYTDNKEHLAPWEPTRPVKFHSLSGWKERAALQEQNARDGHAVHLVARLHGSADIVAVCNFNNIIRGAFLACHLGYSVHHKSQGNGLMQEALAAAILAVFSEYGLHRVMANYMPENTRSGRLLEQLGFEREGYARAYLKIAGQWRDHILTSRINDALE